MQLSKMKLGLRVRVTKLESTEGMMIAPAHIYCRKLNIIGTLKTYVPGHGGDVWFVQHDYSKKVGAYSFTELSELIEEK